MTPNVRPRIREVLECGDATSADIASTLGIPRPRIAACISVWRNRGASPPRIAGWERSAETGGDFKPIWSLSPGEDAPRPKPDTMRAVCKRYWKRNRARLNARRRKSRPDPLLSLLT